MCDILVNGFNIIGSKKGTMKVVLYCYCSARSLDLAINYLLQVSRRYLLISTVAISNTDLGNKQF